MNRTRVLSTFVLLVSAAAVAFTTNASPAGGVRGDEPGESAPRHRARVADPETARQLEEAGGRMLVDYGAFRLYEVPEDQVGAFAGKASVEFDADLDFIYLNAGTIDTRSAEAADRSTAAGSFRGKNMRLVQFIGPIVPSWVAALEATGVEIVCYIPNNAYLVYGDDDSLEGLRGLSRSSSFVQWEGAYLAEDRIHPDARSVDEKGNPRDIGTDQFVVQVIKDKDENERTFALIEGLQLAPALNRFETLHYENTVVRLPERAIADIAARPDVVSIQPYFTPTRRDERQDQIVAGHLSGNIPSSTGYLNQVSTWGFTQAQFTASGFAVDVTDSGIDNATTFPNHFGLYVNGVRPGTSRVVYNRLVGTPNAGSTLQGCDGHGNLNAHIVAGYNDLSGFPHADASGFRYGLGVAPYVRVGSSVIFDPNSFTFPNYASLQSQAYNSGARISTNSWGAAVGGAYNVDSQAYDALVRDAQPAGSTVPAAGNQEMVILFAAGNSGSGANTVGSPGTGKNVITVGASEGVQAFGGADGCGIADTGADSANDIIGFSSRGPCDDGRLKPEIVAPGTHISGGVAQNSTPGVNGMAIACFNATGVCGGLSGANHFPAGQQWYTASSGTSHSCPAVAGGAALLRQFFINQSMTPPSPAMTKAYLSNAARYMNGTGANDTLWSNNQGMGMMNLGMAFDSTARVLRDQVPADMFTATGQTRTFTGTVPDNTRPFRVTIAWTDAPGSTTGNAFNNNLDLTVTVGGMTYRGNVFTGANSMTGGTADVRNNMESVFIPAGVTGAYVITVTATNIVSDGVPNSGGALDQDFALVVSNGVEGVAPVIAAAGSTLTAESCAPANSALDPGETVTLNFGLQNVGTGNTTSLVATLQATGGVTSPSGPQNYGAVVAGGPAITRPFTFTVDSGLACGATVTATFQLQDGATNLGTVTFTFTLGTVSPVTTTFSNTGSITIPATGTSGVASPYPSTIAVSGLSGTITKVTARLVGWSHTFPDDVDVVLIGPAGQSVILASDTGGSSAISNVSITFDDAAAPSLPDGTQIVSGTFKPTNIGGGDTFAAPAPAGPYGSTLSVFNGTAPNGNWRLFVVDDTAGDVGSISGGWQVTITASASTCATTCAAVCTITCPANVTVPAAAGQCSAPAAYAAPTTTGSCGTVTCTPASGSSFPVGTTTVNCTTTAGPGCSFTVTVTDTQAPAVACPANVTVGNTAGQCSAVVNFTTPTASDNCPGATVACVPASGSTFPVGTTTVTCTATDGSANTGTCSFTVTVQDTQAPTVSCPANITQANTAGQCSAVVNYATPTGTDNCPGPVTVVCVPASGSTFPVGTTTVTCTASDGSANSADGTCTFAVTINDTQAPTVACPANVVAPATAGQCSAVVNYTTPTASDNCPGATVVCVPASGSTFPVGVSTITCTATDASSNTGSCSFTVTVQDTQAPVATCPAPITVAAATGTCAAVVSYTATATDNCPGVGVVCAPASGSTFPVGVTTVNCTATDASGNMGTCSFTITVQDTQLPVITCPANITVTTDTTTGCTFSTVVTYPAPVATDNCGLASVVCVPPSGSTFNEGTTTVTCTATDTSGNTAACTFTVTVGAAFGFCSVDDATGNRFQMVVNPASPSYGVWRFTVVATNTRYCGRANYINYVPGIRLRAYDNDYSAENPTFFMDANFKTTAGTVTVRNVSGTIRLTLRDRNLADSVCP